MGLKLDWDIETEAAKSKHLQEDPLQRQKRLRGCRRLVFGVILLTIIIGGIGSAVFWRYTTVTDRLESTLRNTVQAEVAALRIGDFAAFSDIQRSATDAWLIEQQQTFEEYQERKLTENLQLTGNVVDLEISGQRGRVQVEEVVENISYVQTWFYWNYNNDTPDDADNAPDGWRHLPADYTFWGEEARIETERFTIRYRDLDTPIAEALEEMLPEWFTRICALLDCSSVPAMTIDILPDKNLKQVSWATNEATNSWQMVVPSPYVGAAELNMPFSAAMRDQTATILAERFVETNIASADFTFYSDAQYLKQAISTWLADQLVNGVTKSYLINNLVNTYGEAIIGQLLQSLNANTTVGILATVTNNPSLGSMMLDWRDFVAWRLDVEDQLVRERNEAALRQLYDPRDPNIINVALARFDVATAPDSRLVSTVTQGVAADGLPQLQATVQTTRNGQITEEFILFNLVDGRWLRAN